MKLSQLLPVLAFATVPAAHADGPIPTGNPLLMEMEAEEYWTNSLSGGPGKDGIPSIDHPRFHSAGEGDRHLDDGDVIMGVHVDGDARAYPQNILVWHEIVNDTVGGKNLAITYCPLTGTGMGYERGKTELGVSGRLVNSNMLMYDRHSDSYWPQITAAAARGPHKGEGLNEVRVVWTTWGNWKERHPATKVLSERTGHARNYRRDPYGSYNPRDGYYGENASPIVPVLNDDDRYPPKKVIFGFRSRNEAVAVNPERLAREGTLEYSGQDGDFLVVHDPGLDTGWVYRADHGEIPAIQDNDDLQFGPDGPESPVLDDLEPVNGFEAFWFAWYAFYPETVTLSESDD